MSVVDAAPESPMVVVPTCLRGEAGASPRVWISLVDLADAATSSHPGGVPRHAPRVYPCWCRAAAT